MNTIALSSTLETRLQSLALQVGNTPLLPIRRLIDKPGVEIYVKLEWHQIGQSVKARAAYQIIWEAVKSGQLDPAKTLLDATSGNTGIAYAAIAAAVGLKVELVVPENMSLVRKQILQAYGAKLVFSNPLEGGDGAQRLAKELLARNPQAYYYADQYSNLANIQAHRIGTAPEIWEQTQGHITHFVSSLGTTGSFTGTSTALKRLNPQIQAVELQPDIALHALEGWKHLETSDVPKIYDPAVADSRIVVTTDEAHAMMRDAARYEGLLLSSSSAGNLVGALKLANSIDQGVIVTLLPDNADKSTEIFHEIFQ